MLATYNLLKPQDGSPVATPTQDMIFGSYYLTMVLDGEKGEGKAFKDPVEAKWLTIIMKLIFMLNLC